LEYKIVINRFVNIFVVSTEDAVDVNESPTVEKSVDSCEKKEDESKPNRLISNMSCYIWAIILGLLVLAILPPVGALIIFGGYIAIAVERRKPKGPKHQKPSLNLKRESKRLDSYLENGRKV